MTLHDPIELILPATTLSTRLIRPWLDSILELGHGVDRAAELGPRAELALVELCTNITIHGYGLDGGRISLTAGVDETGLTVMVLDSGPEFEPQTVAEPEELQIHGYGLMIIRKLADEFGVSRKDGINRWRLRFTASPRPEGEMENGK